MLRPLLFILLAITIQGLHHKLTKRELLQVFGVEEKDQVTVIRNGSMSTEYKGLPLDHAEILSLNYTIPSSAQLDSPFIFPNMDPITLEIGLFLDSKLFEHFQSYDIYHTTASVAGVAPVARMCDPLFACSLVEGLHLGRSFVLAHEMGHNESGRGNCLRDASPGLSTHNHLNDGRWFILYNKNYEYDYSYYVPSPGQRFTADQQCAYFWGRDYQVEIPSGKSMDDICRILWCGNSGSTISTAHPALEGSFCGNDKWCHEGQCRSWPNGAPPPLIDGSWSQWSSEEKRCPIQQCQVTGSITIKGQHRDCVNPANRVCSSIKHDPIKPDRQLTGEGFERQCPSSDSSRQRRCVIRPCPIWDSWSSWTECFSCSRDEFRSRSRNCVSLLSGFEEQPMICEGSPSQVETCDQWCDPDGQSITQKRRDIEIVTGKGKKKVVAHGGRTVPVDEQKWGQWTDWTQCTASCGGGIRKRTRLCLGEHCPSQPLESIREPCNEGLCSDGWSIDTGRFGRSGHLAP
uniref:ADAM_CR_2 domain-containing protein n=1 Tax=Heterorhabditis bacteriophora TaxID=37862 RepID=A0A1I7X4B0_HETBA